MGFTMLVSFNNECLVCRTPLYHTINQMAYLCENHIGQAEKYYDQKDLFIAIFERESEWVMSIKHAPARFRDDLDFMKIAVSQNWKAFFFASDRLIKDPDLIAIAEKQNPEILNHFGSPLSKIRKSWIGLKKVTMVILGFALFLYLQTQLRNRENQAILKQHQYEQEKEVERLQASSELSRNIYGWPTDIPYMHGNEWVDETNRECRPWFDDEISKEHPQYKAVKVKCLNILKKDGSMFTLMSDLLKDDEDLVLAAVHNAPFIIREASLRLRNDVKFLKELIHENPNVYHVLPPSLKSHPSLLPLAP
jgi:hypothetical protein